MHRVLTALLAVAALAAGGFAIHFHDGLAGLGDQIAALANERDAARAAEKLAMKEAADAKAAAGSVKENIARLTAERDQAKVDAKKAAPIAAPVAGAEATPVDGGKGEDKDFMKGLSKMFEGEEGKKMLRMQSTMAVKMMYGDLAKELKLAPKDADLVMEMLGERQGMLTSAGMSAMSGGEEAGKKVNELKKEVDAKLKAVLGEDGFKQLEGYERTLGDRMMLQQFDGQFAAAGAPLVGQQKQDLLAVMKQERARTPVSPLSQNMSGDPSAGIAAMKDDSAIAAYQKNEEDYQNRVLQNATRTLNPDQINALKKAFEQQRTMMEFGMKMGREMFKNKGGSPSPAPVTK